MHQVSTSTLIKVTAIEFINEDLLVFGSGSFIYLYNYSTNSTLNSYYCFNGNNTIHGLLKFILNDEMFILFFGGMKSGILSLKYNLIHNFNDQSDWILRAKIVNKMDCNDSNETKKADYIHLCLSLCYSFKVIRINKLFSKDQKNQFKTNEVYSLKPKTSSLARSSAIFGNCVKCLVFASGTMFDHFFVWTLESSIIEKEGIKVKEQQKNFLNIPKLASGRQRGTIFDLDWAEDGKEICTVSDDRSVRIWEFEENNLIQKAEIFGHKTRIFSCKWINKFLIASGSEDGVLCLWKVSRKKAQNLKELSLINSVECHRNSIWTISVYGNMIATGCEDGALRVWNSDSFIAKPIRTQVSNSKTTLISVVKCLDLKICLIGTKNGKIFELSDIKQKINVTEIANFGSSVTSISIIYPNLIVIGLKSGTILFYERAFDKYLKKCSFKGTFDKKGIKSLFVSSFGKENKKVILVATQPKSQKALLWFLSKTNFSFEFIGELSFKQIRKKTKIISCAFFIDENKVYIILGDSDGSVHLFSSANSDKIQHNYSERFCHGAEKPVMEIKFISKSFFYTCGRDGKLLKHKIVYNSEKDSPIIKSSKAISCEPITLVEKIFLKRELTCETSKNSQKGTLIVAGFHHLNFYVIELVRKLVLFKTDCNGGRRPYDILIFDKSFYFAYSPSKDRGSLRIHSNKTQSFFANLNENKKDLSRTSTGHSRTINCVMIAFLNNKKFLFTAGEDSDIRVYSIKNDEKFNLTEIEKVEQMKYDKNPIKTMSKFLLNSNKNKKLLVFTGGAKEHLCCTVFSTIKKSIKFEYLFYSKKLTENWHKKRTNKKPLSAEVDVRVLSLVIKQLGADLICVTGDSTGLIKVWKVLVSQCSFKLVKILKPNNLLPILSLRKIFEGDQFIIAIGQTKGNISLMEIKDCENSIIYNETRTLNSVNVIDSITTIKPNLKLIITSGDDQCLSFRAKNDLKLLFQQKASFSSITNIKVINDLIITISLDRIVRVWKQSFEKEKIKLILIGSKRTFIGNPVGLDVSETVLFNSKKIYFVFICGNGFETIKFDF